MSIAVLKGGRMQNFWRQRSGTRRESRVPVTHGYTTIHFDEDQSPADGILSNISDNGACIVTVRRIESGVSVVVAGRAFGSASRNASVVWTREVGSGLYMSGLSLS
jgi:hypothetical protein